MRQKDNFMDDEEKVNDLFLLNKNEFLKRYKYISEEEYNNTIDRIKQIIKTRISCNKRQKSYRDTNIEEQRKRQRKYYWQNREKINARRKYLYQIKSVENKKYFQKMSKEEEKIITEYMRLHKEEIEELKALWQYEKNLLYRSNYYFTKTKKKRQEAKLNGK